MRAAILAGAAKPPGTASPPAGQPAAAPPPADPAVPPPGADPGGPSAGQPEAEPAGLAAIRKAEIHAKRQIAAERAQLQADFDGQKAQWQERITKAQQVEAAIAGARSNPMALITAAGFGDADLEALAHLIYAHSPAGQKDPKRREAAAAALAQREAHGRLDKTERELAELKKGLTDREQQAQQVAQAQAFVGQWLGAVTGAIGDETPLAKAAAARPEQLNKRLLAITDRMWAESGPSDDLREMPDPRAVVKAYEAERRAELEATRTEYELLAARAAPIASPIAAAASPAPTPAAPTQPAAAAPAPAPAPAPNGARKLTREELLEGIKKQRATVAP